MRNDSSDKDFEPTALNVVKRCRNLQMYGREGVMLRSG